MFIVLLNYLLCCMKQCFIENYAYRIIELNFILSVACEQTNLPSCVFLSEGISTCLSFCRGVLADRHLFQTIHLNCQNICTKTHHTIVNLMFCFCQKHAFVLECMNVIVRFSENALKSDQLSNPAFIHRKMWTFE